MTAAPRPANGVSMAEWEFESLGFDPLPGDPTAIQAACDRALALARRLEEQAVTIQRLARPEGWIGEAAEAHADELERLGREMDRYARVQTELAGALLRYRDRFEEARRGALALEQRAADARAALAAGANAASQPVPSAPGGLSIAEAELMTVLKEAQAYQQRFDESVADLAAEVRRLAGRAPDEPLFAALRRWAGQLFRTAATSAPQQPGYLAVALASFSLAQYGTPDERARAVATWASTLTEEWASLMRTDPELVASTGGIPYARRYEANRILIKEALADTGTELEAARQRSDTGAVERLQRREKMLRGLVYDQYGENDRQFLFFDNTGDGRVAEVLGDLEAADHVSLSVPGMDNDFSNYEGFRGNVDRLRKEARLLRPDQQTASIAWLGYDTPGVSGVLFDAEAKAGALALRDFSDGLLLRQEVTTTVVAHSYGSLVTGHALRGGLRVDNVAVIGSPGVGVDQLEDLQLADGTDFWAARAPLDGVTLSEWHGADPTDPRFGGHRFETSQAGDDAFPYWHSDYYDARSESLENLARIVTDQEHLVTVREPSALDEFNIAVDTIQSEIGDAARGVSSTLDSGQDWVDREFGEVHQQVDALQQTAGETLEHLTAGIVDRSAVDLPIDASQRAAAAAHDAAQEIVDVGRTAAESVGDAAGEAVDHVQEGVDKVGDVAEDVTDLGEEGVRRARKWFGDRF